MTMPTGARHICLVLTALQLRLVSGGASGESPFEMKELHRATLSQHKKAPQFMLDLFNAVSVFDKGLINQREILEGNTVRSFPDKVSKTGQRSHFFNLSSLNREEKIIKAEFRWFRKKQQFNHGTYFRSHFYKVGVFEVQDSRVKPIAENFITSRLVPLYKQGWEVFNVTQMVLKWIQNSHEHNGLLVKTFPTGDWLKCGSKNLKLTYTSAYLVIFSDEGRNKASESYLGKSAPAYTKPQDHLSRWKRSSSDFLFRGRPQSCRRVPLFISFEEIGWSGWIISPRGYQAYQCKGSCPFPLGVGLKATNHATVRSIIHTLKLPGEDVEAPCCVPDRMQSISLLYFDDEENVVLKQYDDMVALSCGCQ